MTKLKLARDLALPLEAVTQKLAWIGTTGSGKTYGASKLAELFWDAGAQFIVLDPVGVWLGLRLARDGKHPSDITIPIFGGLHGDIPLESTAGAITADLVVDRAISVILDVSQFESDAQKARFAADFADRFFFRKKASPSAVHVFIEECQEFVPENQQRGEERMLHAFVRMQKIGRNFGIGTSYITQRPQEVAKKALNLTQTLFVFRTTGAHERAAIERWIKDKAIAGQDIMSELPKLQTGCPHVWSPEWLAISEVVHVNEKRTFNASATPEVGVMAKTRHLATIDLDKIRKDMAATIERAKADDPRELKRQIAELKKTVAAKHPKEMIRETKKEIPVLKARDTARLIRTAERIATLLEGPASRIVSDLTTAVSGIRVSLESFDKARGQQYGRTAPVAVREHVGPRHHPAPDESRDTRRRGQHRGDPSGDQEASDGAVVKGGKFRAMMIAMAQAGRPLTEAQVAIRANMSVSGTFDTYIGRMRRHGWIVGSRSGLSLSIEGLAALGAYDPLPRGADLRRYWLGQMGGKQREMLTALIAQYPDTYSEQELATAAQMSVSGTFDTYIGRLRRLKLVEGTRRDLKAASELFEE